MARSNIDWLGQVSDTHAMSEDERKVLEKLKPYQNKIGTVLSGDFYEDFMALICELWNVDHGKAFAQGFRLGAELMLELGWSRREAGDVSPAGLPSPTEGRCPSAHTGAEGSSPVPHGGLAWENPSVTGFADAGSPR